MGIGKINSIEIHYSVSFSTRPLESSFLRSKVRGVAELLSLPLIEASASLMNSSLLSSRPYSSRLRLLASSSGDGGSSSLCFTVKALFRKCVTMCRIRSLNNCSLSGPKMEEISLLTSDKWDFVDEATLCTEEGAGDVALSIKCYITKG